VRKETKVGCRSSLRKLGNFHGRNEGGGQEWNRNVWRKNYRPKGTSSIGAWGKGSCDPAVLGLRGTVGGGQGGNYVKAGSTEQNWGLRRDRGEKPEEIARRKRNEGYSFTGIKPLNAGAKKCGSLWRSGKGGGGVKG